MRTRFLVDACVDTRVADWLRGQGYDAVHLRDQGLQRLPDGEIFRKAAAERRAVVTFDLDFSEIAALSAGRNVSVIVLRLHNTRFGRVIERLSAVLPHSISALGRGAILIIEESRHRFRSLPIETPKQ